jgi:hypothetical protein
MIVKEESENGQISHLSYLLYQSDDEEVKGIAGCVLGHTMIVP